MLLKKHKTPPEKPGKLIGVFADEFFDRPEEKARISSLLNSLRLRRSDIEHRKRIADERFLLSTYQVYKNALLMISNIAHIDLGD